MYGKMNTKFVAALAVFAMLFAGFGAIFVAQADDAADATPRDLIITLDGMISADDAAQLAKYGVDPGEGDFAASVSVKYAAILAEDAQDKITLINMDDYNTYIKPYLEKGKVVFEADDVSEDFLATLVVFTSATVDAEGEIVDGVQTIITFAKFFADAPKDVKIELVDADEAALAVIAAVAVVEAAYADYMSPEEVQAAIAEALADVSEYIYTQEDLDAALAVVPAGYISAADAKAEQEKAVADAVAAAIAGQPDVKKDDTFMYVAIALAAVVIALAGLFVYVNIVKPKLAKKKAEQPQA